MNERYLIDIAQSFVSLAQNSAKKAQKIDGTIATAHSLPEKVNAETKPEAEALISLLVTLRDQEIAMAKTLQRIAEDFIRFQR